MYHEALNGLLWRSWLSAVVELLSSCRRPLLRMRGQRS